VLLHDDVREVVGEIGVQSRPKQLEPLLRAVPDPQIDLDMVIVVQFLLYPAEIPWRDMNASTASLSPAAAQKS
jgi:hypothetical protein